MSYRASAPGSLMLLGEYAVLQNYHALVSAVNKRMQVTLTPRIDKKILINSALGSLETDLDNLKIQKPFQFVLAALIFFRKKMKVGCDITIESEFSSTIGFASSAAVTVAAVTALMKWLKIDSNLDKMIKICRSIVFRVQGMGSGADVAACVMGGIVHYRKSPYLVDKMQDLLPISVIYSGSKTATPRAVSFVNDRFKLFPNLYKIICKSINSCVIEAVSAFSRQDQAKIGEIMNIQQGLMNALGVDTNNINIIISELKKQPGILGAKISGSGLGDCVIGLGQADFSDCHFSNEEIKPIEVKMTSQGVFCEEI